MDAGPWLWMVHDAGQEQLAGRLARRLGGLLADKPQSTEWGLPTSRVAEGQFAVVLIGPNPSTTAMEVLGANRGRAIAVTSHLHALPSGVVPVRISAAPSEEEVERVAEQIIFVAVPSRGVELTPSVTGTRNRFADRAVAGYELAVDLLRGHPIAARRTAAEDLARAAPAGDVLRPGPNWIELIERLLQPSDGKLHARLAIVGLALADGALGRWMADDGLLRAVEDELREPVRTQLTAAGLRLRDALEGAPLPGYVPDSTAGRDLLGIEPDVAAFAAIMAARDTEPPVSVGLFGRWGTGKSFFMERLRERIESLGRENPDLYCAEVVQIRFNAWHYIDANLWASLAAHIFGTLAAHGKPVGGDGGDRKTENLLLNLTTTGELVERKRAEQEEAEEGRKQVEKELARLIKRKGTERSELAKLDVGGITDAVERDEEVKQRFDAAREALGVDADVAKGLLDVAQRREGRGVAGRLPLAWRYLRARPLLLALAVIAAAALTVVMLAVGTGWVAAAGALVVPIVTVGGAILRVTGPVGALLDSAERARAARAEELRAELRELEQRAEQARTARTEAEAREREARRELERATSGSGLRRFIEERAASDEYSRLGIIAAVQRDFERLSQLMARSRDGEPAMDDDGNPLPDIDRIVLYVDDLDRCPPQTVVDVLEAVHLLMAFPLFVVVVGVDPGWLERSLSATRLRSEHAMSSPRDYLEKIFQIPFVLRPMGGEGYARLVGGLLPIRAAQGEPDSAPAAVSPAPSGDEAASVSIGDAAREPSRPAQTRVFPPSLTIDPPEMEALTAVGPLISTPRAVKRLVNAYRFIRAGVGPDELDDFVGYEGQAGAYKAVVAMLAALIAFPDDAPAFFAEALVHDTWGDWVESRHSAQDLAFRPVQELDLLMDIPPDYSTAHFARWIARVERFSFGLGPPAPTPSAAPAAPPAS